MLQTFKLRQTDPNNLLTEVVTKGEKRKREADDEDEDDDDDDE